MILVTGGAGYIGSHCLVALAAAGYDFVVIDNLSNSSRFSLERAELISGKKFPFLLGDIRDQEFLRQVFKRYEIDSVIHLAGLKSVAESVQNPLGYYDCNVSGTLTLCQSMKEAGVFKLIFSSSSTIYGDPTKVPILEDCTGTPTSPYGMTKLISERLLQDVAKSDPSWRIGCLRYFNPIGAHESGLIGEAPTGTPNNLMPYLTQVAVGKRELLSVYGNDYSTLDGTGVRDYIHVMDLAEGHVSVLKWLNENSGFDVWNLGTGTGYSVLQILAAFQSVSYKKIKYEIVGRRPGDIAECFGDIKKAEKELGWKAKRDLVAMVADSWNWQSLNPDGYKSEDLKVSMV